MPSAALSSSQRSLPKSWVPTVLLVFVCWFVLGSLDDTVVIRPVHSGNNVAILIMTAMGGLIGVAAGVPDQARRDGLGTEGRLILALTGAVGAWVIGGLTLVVLEQARDFPRSGTVTRIAYVPVTEAYETHMRGPDWHIRLPFVGPLGIVSQDYWRMPPSQMRDRARSDGFCARITVQSSRRGVRILHYRLGRLPPGTVVPCPPKGVDRQL